MNQIIEGDGYRIVIPTPELSSSELRDLVFSAYTHSLIAEGRAMDLLKLDRLDYSVEFAKWLVAHPNIQY